MYVKLFTQILDSSIAENRKLRHFFTDLLLCADFEGAVMMTSQAIARRIGASLEEVEWGLKELQKPDPLSKTSDHDGRRIEQVDGHGYGWKVLNFEFYRSLKDYEQLKIETKERVRKHRERKKLNESKAECNSHVTPCNTGNDIEIQIENHIKREDTSNATSIKEPKKSSKVTDEEFISSLTENIAYHGINVKVQLAKMDAWLLANPNRQKTRRFVVNWLNKCDRPVSGNGHSKDYSKGTGVFAEGDAP